MAWEKLTLARRNSVVPLVSLSVVWAALVIAAAFLTNFDEPYLPFAIGGALVFFLRGAPSRWEIYAWLSTSVLFVKIVHLPQVPFWVLRVASSFAVLGFSALLLLGLRALWSEREGRENALALIVPAVVLIVFMLACANMLRLTSGLSPDTDDAWLYAFDGTLGFQPSFWVGRIMYDSAVLTRITLLTYLSLPFAMAVVCACKIPVAARRVSWHVLTVLSLAGVAGWLFYNVVPGTGPIYAFARDFPWNSVPYKDLSKFALEKMPIPLGIPRNGMPSLHVGWLILLWWNSRGFPKVLRAALALYLFLTVVATLGTGQHYFVDLVVSMPFALAVQAAASYALPNINAFQVGRRTPQGLKPASSQALSGTAKAVPCPKTIHETRSGNSRHITALVAGLGLTLAWLLLVRFGVPWALKSPVIPWTLIVATASITLWLESWMAKCNSAKAATENVPVFLPKLARSLR